MTGVWRTNATEEVIVNSIWRWFKEFSNASMNNIYSAGSPAANGK